MNQTSAALHLNFSVQNDQTILRVLKQEPPLRVIRAFPIKAASAIATAPSPQGAQPVLVHLHNISGGLLGGDRLQLRAHVEAGAQAQITSTGSTRVYRQRVGYPITTQISHLQVNSGGLLEYLPDTLIPYARSQYRQSTRIELADNAGLFYWEVVTPGREAKGECFEYDLLQIELDILANGQPIAIERSQLEPKQAALNSAVKLGLFRYFATFYICRVGIEAQHWLDLEKQLDQLARSLTVAGQMVWGVSSLSAHGLSVRAVSTSSQAIQQHLPCFWQMAKQALYQQNAVMPRKVY